MPVFVVRPDRVNNGVHEGGNCQENEMANIYIASYLDSRNFNQKRLILL